MRRICLLVAIVMTLGHSFRSAGLPALSAGGTAAIDRMFQAAVDKGEIFILCLDGLSDMRRVTTCRR